MGSTSVRIVEVVGRGYEEDGVDDLDEVTGEVGQEVLSDELVEEALSDSVVLSEAEEVEEKSVAVGLAV